MPICSKCSEDKTRDDFYIGKKSGRRSTYCKECTRELARNRYRGPDGERIRRDTVARTKARRDGAAGRVIRGKEIEQQRGGRYGMTADEYAAFIAKPCEICGTTTRKRGVDHCHTTDANRGALCHQCNVGLGMYGDNPALLRAAAAYLEA